MRIIAGSAKGRKILSPIGRETRPTLDRIKEAIFNIIQSRVYGSIVVDIFAGTGSLGLEAASRGAKQCYLIDKSPNTYPLLRQNIQSLKFEDICQSFNKDSYIALKEFADKKIKFDIIFIDPPYAKEMIPLAIDIVFENKIMKDDGIIVTKIDSSEKIYEGNDGIVLTDKRRYGNTTVCFYKYKEE